MTGIFQVVGELRYQLIRVFEEKDVVTHTGNELAEALTDPESLQV